MPDDDTTIDPTDEQQTDDLREDEREPEATADTLEADQARLDTDGAPPADAAKTEDDAATTDTAAAATVEKPAQQQPPAEVEQQRQRNNEAIERLQGRLSGLRTKLKDQKYDSFEDGAETAGVIVDAVDAVLGEINELRQQNERLQEHARAERYWSSDFRRDYPGVAVELGKQVFAEEMTRFATEAGLSGPQLVRAASAVWKGRMAAIQKGATGAAAPVAGGGRVRDPATGQFVPAANNPAAGKTPVTPNGARVTPAGVSEDNRQVQRSVEDELALGSRGKYAGLL